MKSGKRGRNQLNPTEEFAIRRERGMSERWKQHDRDQRDLSKSLTSAQPRSLKAMCEDANAIAARLRAKS